MGCKSVPFRARMARYFCASWSRHGISLSANTSVLRRSYAPARGHGITPDPALAVSIPEQVVAVTGHQQVISFVARTPTNHLHGSVLDELGDLVSERGGLQEARKLDANATLRPLTPEENAWVRAALKMLIRRKAAYDRDSAAAGSLPSR